MHPIDHEIRSLETEHDRLERELADELARAHPDELRVPRLKKEKPANRDWREELRRYASGPEAA